MRLVVLALAALLPVVVAACGGDDGASADAALPQQQPLVLVSGVDVPQAASSPRPSATFDAGMISGSTGCNRYSGDVTLDGSSLEIGQVVATRMACPPPADAVEQAYLAALAKVGGWRADGDEIVLVDADDAELLRYERATPTGSWQVTGLLTDDALSSPVAGTELSADFDDEGRLSGSSGCNTYSAAYTIEGGTIEIGDVAGTKKSCAEPAGVMQQETAYLALLDRVSSFSVDGGTLTLLDVDRQQLVVFAAR